MSTRTLTPTDRDTYSPKMSYALQERAMDDLLEGAEDHEREITHGFDEDQLDDGNPCTIAPWP